jgi:hypothetical protein
MRIGIALTACTLAARVQAAVPYAEDLSACKLPNGVVTLPAPGSKLADRGDLLKISSATFSSVPVADGNHIASPAQMLQTLRESKSADLRYLPDNHGSLWVVSGRITELGAAYLSDAGSMKLSEPMAIPATSRTPAGLFPGVAEGRTYLVEAVDGHFALLRILEKTPEVLVAQYVYQPLGGPVFDIPKGDHVPYQTASATTQPAGPTSPASPAVPPPNPPGFASIGTPGSVSMNPNAFPGGIPAAPNAQIASSDANLLPPTLQSAPSSSNVLVLRGDPAGTDNSLDQFNKQREQLIARRMSVATAPARTAADIERKAQAITDLGILNADQAADMLALQISFLNTRSTAREFSPDALHPCFAALKHLGKAGSTAALKALRQLNLEGTAEGIDSPSYKAGLLAAVIRAVEGEDIANFLLQKEMDKETSAKRRDLYAFLLGKQN